MKNAVKILSAYALIATLAMSCNKTANTGFNPEDRTSVDISEQEKETRLQELKNSDMANIDSLLYGTTVKMSVLPPSATELSESQAERMAVKMLQLLTQNGIGGLNTVPGFALTATLTVNSKTTTGSAPQKYMVDYNINYSVINTVTGDVYSTSVQKIAGVGNSFEQATNNAINAITINPETNKMIAEGSAKIVEWYNSNVATLRNQVATAETSGDLALALSLINAVPSQAPEAFAYAESRRSSIENKFMQQISQKELAAMKEAIILSDNEPDAQIYAHYGLIAPTSAVYGEAQSLLNKYEQDVADKRARESAQRQANLEVERQQQMELAKMENSLIKAKYQAQASEQAIRLYLSQNSSGGGFWRNLGSRIIGAIDGTNWQYKVSDKPYTND